jgi:hypothetical protein
MRRAIGAGALILAAAAAAGCQSAGSAGPGAASASSSSAARPASSAAPAAAAWQPGGTYTGPVPPTDPMPTPPSGWRLKLFVSVDGYKSQDSLRFGVPLHYRIPNRLIDCIRVPYSQDLPPGQVVIPLEVKMTNLTGQQSPGLAPWVHVTDASGNADDINVTGQTGFLWGNGDCTSSLNHVLGSGGSDTMFGLIGPATPAQLEGATVTATWAGTDAPDQSIQLQRVLPHIANSWLIAHS